MALVVWSDVIGIPNDPWAVLITLWLLTIAWNVEAPWRHHLGFLRDWSVPALLLAVYFYSRGWVDEFDITVHWTMPIEVDRWLFGGTLPTTTLQEAWCGDPCTLQSPVRWYDTLFTTVYATHFVVGLTLAVWLWARNRTEWLVWMRRYLGLNFAGLAIYVVYPMAPPWMASDEGYIETMEPDHLARLGRARPAPRQRRAQRRRQPGRGDALAARGHGGARRSLRHLAAALRVALAAAGLPAVDVRRARLLRRALRRRRDRRRPAGRGW